MSNKDSNKIHLPVAVNFAAFVIIIGGVMYAKSIVTPFLMALFISIICAAPIGWLQKKNIPQTLSIILVFLGIVSIFFIFGEIIGNSVSSFSEDLPQYEKNLSEIGGNALHFLQENGLNVEADEINKVIEPSRILGYTAGFLGQMGGFMGNAATIFLLALFLLFELDSIYVKAMTIAKNTNVSIAYLNTIGQNIRHYLSIKTITSFLTGFAVWLLLMIIGVKYTIVWALLAFLLNYIPNIGSILAAIPAVLFALIQLGLGGAFWAIIAFVLVNMIVGNVIEPKMMGKGLGLSTLIVFVSLIFWGFVLGTVGMFLSVPLTMAIKIMLEQQPKTRWIAVVLGTEEDANKMLNGGNRSSKTDS